MVEGKATLVIDLGNSETRVTTKFGKTKNGRARQKTTILDNRYGGLSNLAIIKNPDYNSESSKVFELENGSVFCVGEMCEIEKGTASLRPSVSNKKYESDISTYSLILCYLQGYNDIAEMSNTELDSINVEWDVTVLLPPSDLELGAQLIREKVQSIKKIKFLMPEFEQELKITQVRVLPEGYCAFIGVAFESATKFRKGFKEIVKASTLIVDIGAGTTDLSIIKNAKLVDSSRHTEETGGNQVFQKVNLSLRREYGKNFPESSLRTACVTGLITLGASEKDIKSEIEIAKEDIAVKLSSAIRNYIESSDFSIYDIQYILICGGGAEESEVEEMKSLGEYLKDDIKRWMEFSKFIEIPKETGVVIEDGETVSKSVITPRLLNIIGAGILSE